MHRCVQACKNVVQEVGQSHVMGDPGSKVDKGAQHLSVVFTTKARCLLAQHATSRLVAPPMIAIPVSDCKIHV